MRESFLRRLFVLSCTAAIVVLLPVIAAGQVPKRDPKLPPPIIDVVSAEQLQGLLNDIDKGDTFINLDIGYFTGHRKSPLAKDEAVALVEKAASAVAPGSRKWFYLNALLARGEIYCTTSLALAGITQYGEIFSYCDYAKGADALPVVERCMTSMMFAIKYRLPSIGMDAGPQGKEGMKEAWNAFITYVLPNGRKIPLGPWIKLADFCGVLPELAEATMPAVQNAKYPTKDPDVVFLMLDMVSRTKPEVALAGLLKAEKTLGDPIAKDPRRLALMSACYIALKQPDKALAARNEMVKSTGSGQSDLLTVLIGMGNMVGVQKALDDINVNTVPYQELIKCTEALTAAFGNDTTQRAAVLKMEVDLLQRYLSADLKRRPDNELQATYLLARNYALSGAQAQARAVLEQIITKPAPTGGVAQINYQQAKELYLRLSAAMSTEREQK